MPGIETFAHAFFFSVQSSATIGASPHPLIEHSLIGHSPARCHRSICIVWHPVKNGTPALAAICTVLELGVSTLFRSSCHTLDV